MSAPGNKAVVLHLDASARGERSHTRRLGRRFVEHWLALRPGDEIVYRDIGRDAPPPVSDDWIAAAFTQPGDRTPPMQSALAVSDELVDELIRADIIAAGVPMYNFGVPAQMKAYIDNVVRVGRTFSFDPSQKDQPYKPLLTGKRLAVLSARGDSGFSPGGHQAHLNHVEPYLKSVFGWLGVNEFASVAIENDEHGEASLNRSIAEAEMALKRLAESWAAPFAGAAGGRPPVPDGIRSNAWTLTGSTA